MFCSNGIEIIRCHGIMANYRIQAKFFPNDYQARAFSGRGLVGILVGQFPSLWVFNPVMSQADRHRIREAMANFNPYPPISESQIHDWSQISAEKLGIW